MLIVHKRPGEPAAIIEANDDLPTMKALLDGGWLELVRVQMAGTELDLWCDEEGRNKGLPPNVVINGEPVYGPVFVTASLGDTTIGLTTFQAGIVRAALNESVLS